MLSVMSKNKEVWKANMIKTLRITSIIAAALAVVFFVFPAVFGVRSDEQLEQFLNSAGVIEKFNKAKGKESTKGESQISPLVKQAEAFALYLNPPKPKKAPPTRRTDRPSIIPRPPAPVSPKFKLIGTSHYASHPELSLALIDEVGKGLRWVRQSSKLGHLIIEQVKDGLVVVRDGRRTFELVAERPEKRSLLKEPLSRATGSKPILSALGKANSHITSSKTPQASAEKGAASALDKAGGRITGSRAPQRNAEETAALQKEQAKLAEKIFAELEAMQADIESDKTDSEHAEENTVKTKKDLESTRISAKEAKRLNHLGKKLKDVQQDPNQVKDDRTESNANLSEPNLSEPNSPEGK